MKTARLNTFNYFFICFLFASCATPRTIVRMSPVSEQVKWNFGQAYASDTVAGVYVEAAFDKATKEYAIFDITILNGSNMSYLVEPESFVLDAIVHDSILESHTNAVDPEIMLLSIDKKISQNEADAKNAKVGAAIATGALVATAVVVSVAAGSDIEPRYHHHYRSVDPDLFLAPIILNAATNDIPADYLSSDDQYRDVWANITIRKTTLEPGYQMQGKVFFPRNENPGTYVLKLPVDDGAISIPFKQLNYYP